jgi:stress response protein YsnF
MHNLVAVYHSRDTAERTRDQLLEFGIPAGDIRLSAAGAVSGEVGSAGVGAGDLPPQRHEGFWDWLFGYEVPEDDRSWYGANLREGRAALSVLVRNEAQQQRVLDILDESNPVHVDDRSATGEPIVQHTSATTGLGVAGDALGTERSGGYTGQTEVSAEGERVIPAVKEELTVGKRAAERRFRIRTYVVETPTEEQVTLRDERVIVERRPVASDRAAEPGALQEREFEVVERHEEPVVEKRARAVEEVVVHREAKDRVETVRDTVRETRVDVDKEPASQADLAGTLPPNRRP